MKNQIVPLIIISVAAFSGAAANLLFKRASNKIFEVPIYQNFELLIGLALFTLVLILFIAAFRLGGETVIVYPCYATTYIWIAFLSSRYEGTTISSLQSFGMLFVILGVSLIGMGFKNSY